MSLLRRIANQLILDNTTDFIDPEGRRRVEIPCGNGFVEAWITQSADQSTPNPNAKSGLFCLKFPGTGGRAERAGPHPAELLSPNDFETWTINPPGYGAGESIRAEDACVTKMPSTCESAWNAIKESSDGKPIVVTGNSLGCMYALFVAARYPVAGVLLRNPAPVHQLIRSKYSRWSLGLANLIGNQVPSEMDAVANASKCSAPALFITSECDRMIPPAVQQKIVDVYGGESSVFVIRDADHHTPLPEEQFDEYKGAIATWAGRWE